MSVASSVKSRNGQSSSGLMSESLGGGDLLEDNFDNTFAASLGIGSGGSAEGEDGHMGEAQSASDEKNMALARITEAAERRKSMINQGLQPAVSFLL
jgi:hypothetical protein